MAGQDDDRPREDLSDEPSPYRIEQMRKKGQVAQSKELSGLIALIAAGFAIYVSTPIFGGLLTDFMKEAFRVDVAASLDMSNKDVMMPILIKGLQAVAYFVLPVALATFVFGALGSFSQVGSVFSTEPLNIDFNKINPIKGAKQFLTMKKLYDGFRLVFRASVIAIVAVTLLKTEVINSTRFVLSDPASLLPAYSSISVVIFLSLCAVLLIFAGFDFWLQRWDYGKRTRLTKQEAKEEHKEREGDPLIRARIRSVQKEMARQRMMEAVKTADVIVTNPTHIACALVYNQEDGEAPKLVAKGADFLAEQIKKLARNADVPVVENKPLARTIYKTVKVNQFIPRSLYKAVAEVLAYVYRLKNRNV